jgi:hypothetical protein
VIRLSLFAWFFPVLVPQNQIAFFLILAPASHHSVCTNSPPRRPSHCAPLWTMLRTEVSMFFFCKGARLQVTALQAGHQTLASAIRGGDLAPVLGGDFAVDHRPQDYITLRKKKKKKIYAHTIFRKQLYDRETYFCLSTLSVCFFNFCLYSHPQRVNKMQSLA